MLSSESLLILALITPVALAIIVASYLLVVKKRLERSREHALENVADKKEDLSNLTRIEKAIYTSEVFWKDATGIIQDRLFRQLGILAESVERFNRSLSAIPSAVDNRVPPAVAMVASALEDSAVVFRSAASTFQRAAENISSYGANYSSHMEELRSAIGEFVQREREFEGRLQSVMEERLTAERNLTNAINEKAESIRKGRVFIG